MSISIFKPVLTHAVPLSVHHKFDDAFPGICFLGDPQQTSMTSEGGDFSWADTPGITLHVPPQAVPEGETCDLSVQMCLSGPFVPPEDYELVGPVYKIGPTVDFTKDVQLSLTHFSNVQTEEDSSRITFVSARSSPSYEQFSPKYKFKALTKGVFQTGTQIGVISLKHFCHLATARRKNKQQGSSAKGIFIRFAFISCI